MVIIVVRELPLLLCKPILLESMFLEQAALGAFHGCFLEELVRAGHLF